MTILAGTTIMTNNDVLGPLAAVDAIFGQVRRALGKGRDHNLAFVQVVGGAGSGVVKLRALSSNGHILDAVGEPRRRRLVGRREAFEVQISESLVRSAGACCTRRIKSVEESTPANVYSVVDRTLANRLR